MLKNKKNVRKIRNIIVLLITIILIFGFNISINAAIEELGLGENVTIKPTYKPEWTRVSSSINTGSKTLTVRIKGSAYKEPQTITGTNVSIQYLSNVISTLSTEDIIVYVDGKLDGDINENGTIDTGESEIIQKTLTLVNGADVTKYGDADCDGDVDADDITVITNHINSGTTLTNEAKANADVDMDGDVDSTDLGNIQKNINNEITLPVEVQYEITLSGFEEATRRTGKSYKELSGNIKLKIKGRGEDPTTYTPS